LAMAVLAAIIMPALLLEDEDLVVELLLKHGRGHFGAGDGRLAGLGIGAFADHQDVVQRDARAFLGIELLDENDLVLGDPVLLAAGADHCIHGWLFAECSPGGSPARSRRTRTRQAS